nr:hypothetical protein [Lysobacter enzymogenes]
MTASPAASRSSARSSALAPLQAVAGLRGEKPGQAALGQVCEACPGGQAARIVRRVGQGVGDPQQARVLRHRQAEPAAVLAAGGQGDLVDQHPRQPRLGRAQRRAGRPAGRAHRLRSSGDTASAHGCAGSAAHSASATSTLQPLKAAPCERNECGWCGGTTPRRWPAPASGRGRCRR